MSKAEILQELPKLDSQEREEILDRLCELREADFGPLHQRWVDEALNSGPACPATNEDWVVALRRGLARSENGS